jgi:two-component system catabolic regulation response regulator CreB
VLPIAIDHERKRIAYFGEVLDLSRYEFRLLEFLAARPGRVFSRAQLMDAAWEEPEASMERTVDAHIKSLRAKLRSVRPDIDAIRTHRGFGYSLIDNL